MEKKSNEEMMSHHNQTVVGIEELETLKRKAKEYDEVYAFLESVYEYDEETGEPIENGHDLSTIGEEICTMFGYL